MPVLAEWVPIRDVAFLDSAICNEVNRNFYLQLIAGENFRHSNDYPLGFQDLYFWLAMRGMRVKKLNLREYGTKKWLNNKLIDNYLKKLQFVELFVTQYNQN